MASNYDEIRAANITGYGEHTHHLAYFGKLYADRSHFIFELLQNAEDTNATQILFRLLPDHLQVLHDGRVFNADDVRGICGIGEGTKGDDLTKIGKFGVGFKAVYAYVDVPVVHSSEEHFRIEHYVRPFGVERAAIDEGFTTLFSLPFKGGADAVATAFADISVALRKLNLTTLLFLRKIETIRVETHGLPPLQLQRIVESQPATFVRRIYFNSTNAEHHPEVWLVFDRSVQVAADDGKKYDLRVEGAFYVKRSEQGHCDKIESLQRSQLIVFFPTEKLMNLGFLIQGPYRTTPTRENVPTGDLANQKLILATAELVIQALHWLKENGMLTVSVLESLPLEKEQFPDDGMFRPIFDRVVTAIGTEAFLPSFPEANDPGGFVAGRNAKAAGSMELRQLLSVAQITELFAAGDPVHWLTEEITEKRTPRLWHYLRQVIGVEEIDAERFVRKLTPEFLKKQSDAWLAEFYVFLSEQRAWLNRFRYGSRDAQSVPFIDKPIIRLESGQHVAVQTTNGEPAAFLPASGPTSVPCVKREVVATKEAAEFLAALGLETADEYAEVTQHVLPKYAGGAIPPMPMDEYRRDLEQIFRVLGLDSVWKRQQLTKRLRELPFVRAQNAKSGEYRTKKPQDVYFRSSELEMYFDGNLEAWLLGPELEGYREQLKELGVAEMVRVTLLGRNWQGYEIVDDRHGNHRRGLDGFDPTCQIDGLQHALANPNPVRSAFIWNRLLHPHAKHIRGTVESSRRSTYEGSERTEESSPMGRLAVRSKWLPAREGGFVAPTGEIALDDLPADFVRDEELARRLGMKSSRAAAEEIAKHLGMPVEMIDYMARNRVSPEEFEEFKKWHDSQNARTGALEKERDSDERRPSGGSGHQPESAGAGESPEQGGDSEEGHRKPVQGESDHGPHDSGRKLGVEEHRPHPEEGLKAQEWLREELRWTLLPEWEVSLAEQATPGDRGRTDILVTRSTPRERFHIEAKRIEGRKIYWSERQIELARNHHGRYFIALVNPVSDGQSYDLHWVWDPLVELERLERTVQWTWRESPEGSFGTDWQPAGIKPQKAADSFRAVVELPDEILGKLPCGVEALSIWLGKR